MVLMVSIYHSVNLNDIVGILQLGYGSSTHISPFEVDLFGFSLVDEEEDDDMSAKLLPLRSVMF